MLAQLIQNEKVIKEIPLTFEGEESTFVGNFTHDTEGKIDLVILAMDPANANFGIVRQQLQVVSE